MTTTRKLGKDINIKRNLVQDQKKLLSFLLNYRQEKVSCGLPVLEKLNRVTSEENSNKREHINIEDFLLWDFKINSN